MHALLHLICIHAMVEFDIHAYVACYLYNLSCIRHKMLHMYVLCPSGSRYRFLWNRLFGFCIFGENALLSQKNALLYPLLLEKEQLVRRLFCQRIQESFFETTQEYSIKNALMYHPISEWTLCRLPPVENQNLRSPQSGFFVYEDKLNGLLEQNSED